LTTRADCIKGIAAVREAIKDPNLAYVARTRLRRSILSCTRLVAVFCGCTEPELPGPFYPPSDASHSLKNIASTCNRIYNATSNLCQPSEPLESRWRNAWSALETDLQSLESMLQSLPDFA
jgi:hypothetical protein